MTLPESGNEVAMLKRDKHFETELIEKEEVIQKFLEIEASRSLELWWISISEVRRWVINDPAPYLHECRGRKSFDATRWHG